MLARAMQIVSLESAYNSTGKKQILQVAFEKPSNLLGLVEISPKASAVPKDPYMPIGEIRDDYIKAEAREKLLSNALLRLNEITGNEYAMLGIQRSFDTIAQETIKNVCSLTYEQYLFLKRHYTKNKIVASIGYLLECPCALSRKKHALVRQLIDDQLVKHMSSFYPAKDQRIIITDVAAGDLFPLFMTLNILVVLSGYKNIKVNLIDKKYNSLLQRYKAKAQEHQKNVYEISQCFPFNLKDEQSGLNILLADFKNKKRSEQAINEFIALVDDYRLHNTFAQFARWFKSDQFTTIDIGIYDSVDEYLKAVKAGGNSMSDVVLVIDYPLDKCPELYKAFYDLSKDALKQTGIAFSLSKKEECGAPELQVYLSKATYNNIEHYQCKIPIKKTAEKFCFEAIQEIPQFLKQRGLLL